MTAFDTSAFLPRSGLERAVSDVIGGIGLLKMTGGSRTADTPEAQALSGRIQAAVGQLVSAQRKDGGWSWTGRVSASKSDRYLSSRMVWALSRARGTGYAVPNDTFDKAVKFLRSAFTATNQSDREAQAIILHGLAEAGAADFAFANRLYRERNNLSPSGLLHVALVLARLDRKEMAGELLQLVKISIDAGTANGNKADPAIRGCIPWMQTGVELRSLYLLALQAVAPTDAKAAKLAAGGTPRYAMDTGKGKRTGHRRAGRLVLANQTNGREIHAVGLRQRSAGGEDCRRSFDRRQPPLEGSRRIPRRRQTATADQLRHRRSRPFQL